MSWNFWRHLRLASSIFGIIGIFLHRSDMLVYAVAGVMIGTVNGLTRVESILRSMEKEDDK